MTLTRIRVATVALILAGSFAMTARADKIVLRGGGLIKGKVLPNPSQADRVSILTERGATPLMVDKSKITQIIVEPSVLDEYLARREKTSESAEPQFELGRWSEENKLHELARLHYRAAVKADDHFGPAHKKLGHILHGDRWLTLDELREAQGLVKHKGKWMTAAEKESREKLSAVSVEQATMTRRFRKLREAILSGSDDRRREADSELMALRDRIAIAPLIKVFGEDPAPVRSMLARVLGEIEGPEASGALVVRFLDDEEADVRLAVLEVLRRREPAEVTKRLLSGLKSDDTEIVNRAAWALATLNAIKTIPNLVGVLVQTKMRVEEVVESGGGGSGMPVNRPSRTGSGHAGGGATNVPGGTVTVPGGVASSGGSVGIGSFSPDTIAGLYGNPALSGGNSPGVYNNGSGLSTNNGSITSGGRSPQLVQYTIQNGEVLAALIKMTGKDFGYDVDSWKRWLRNSFRPDPSPTRRVPQP